MPNNNVTIKQLRFELGLDNESDFNKYSNEVSKFVNEDFVTLLQEFSNDFFSKKDTIYLDSITLNIGELDFSNKNNLKEKIKIALKKEITSKKYFIDINKNTTETLVKDFLKSGILPWWTNTKEKANAFIASNTFNEFLINDFNKTISKNTNTFNRFLDLLDDKNKADFFKKNLANRYAFFVKSSSFFLNLIKNHFNTEDKKYSKLIDYQLFKLLIVKDNNEKVIFKEVLKNSIENYNISWSLVEKQSQKKQYKNLPFKDDLLYFYDPINTNNSSKTLILKNYLEFGFNTNTSNILFISTILTNLIAKEKTTLRLLFKELEIEYPQGNLALIRLTKILTNNNFEPFLAFVFNTEKSVFLSSFFKFLNLKKSQGILDNISLFTFLVAIFKIKFEESSSKNVFYKAVINTVSVAYKINYNQLKTDYYYFTSLSNNKTSFDSIVENLYQKEEKNLFFRANFSSISEESKTNYLSNNDAKIFKKIKKTILYLTAKVDLNSWSKSDIENFIIKYLLNYKLQEKHIEFLILEKYSELNKFQFYKTVLAILKHFKNEFNFIYVVYLTEQSTFLKLSKTDKEFVENYILDNNLTKKIQVFNYKFYPNLSQINTIESLFPHKNESLFNKNIAKKHTYLVEEFTNVLNTLSEVKTPHLEKILYFEIKKNLYIQNEFSQQLLITVSKQIKIKPTELMILVLKSLVGKKRYHSFDTQLIEEISTLFFRLGLNSVNKKEINKVYKLLNKIDVKSTKRRILAETIATSKLAILRLTNSNYTSLIKNISQNKTDYLKILNSLFLDISSNNKVAIFSELKIRTIKIVKEKSLTKTAFLSKIFKEIETIDPNLHKKLSKDKLLIKDLEKQDVAKNISNTEVKSSFKPTISLESEELFQVTNNKDFDYFLNLKNENLDNVKNPFLELKFFKSLEEILKNKNNLRSFLKLYRNDFELLAEFTQVTFSLKYVSILENVLKRINYNALSVENYLIFLQEKTFFSTLNFSDYKKLLRIHLLKTIAFSNSNKIESASFTLDFVEILTLKRKINFRQTTNISKNIKEQNAEESEIKQGLTAFFDKNNYQQINSLLREDEYSKNVVYFFLKNNKTPDWATTTSLSSQDVFDFIKLKIKRKDVVFLEELFSDKNILKLILNNFTKDKLRLDLLEVLCLNKSKLKKIDSLYQEFTALELVNDKYKKIVFESIINDFLWQNRSFLYVIESLFFKLEKIASPKELVIFDVFFNTFSSSKLVLKREISFTKNDTLEIIRYYLQQGSLPKIYKNNKKEVLENLKKYSKENNIEISFMLLEFSKSKEISKNFISIISKETYVHLITQELIYKDKELNVFFKNLKLLKYNLMVLDAIVNNFIAPKFINNKNIANFLEIIKQIDFANYKELINRLNSLNFDIEKSTKLEYLHTYSKSIIFTNANDLVYKNKSLRSELTPVNQLKLLKEKLLNPSALDLENLKKEKVYILIEKNNQNVDFRNYLHAIISDNLFLLNLIAIYPKTKILTLLSVIDVKFESNYLNPFNIILEKTGYKNFNVILDVSFSSKLVHKTLTIWAFKHVFASPISILESLVNDSIDKGSLNKIELSEKLNQQKQTFTSLQKKLTENILKNFAKKNTISENTKNKKNDFDVFIVDLKNAVNLGYINENYSRKIYFEILQYKSQTYLKELIFDWSKDYKKLQNLINLFPEKEVFKLVATVIPKFEKEYLDTFNSILKQVNYNTLESYLNINSRCRLAYNVLQFWSIKTVKATPINIMANLFNQFLLKEAIQEDELFNQFLKIQPKLSISEQKLLISVLEKAKTNHFNFDKKAVKINADDEFVSFIKELSNYVESNSLDTENNTINNKRFRSSILKNSTNSVLKKKLFNWSKDLYKLEKIVNLFAENEVSSLIKFINPKFEQSYLLPLNTILSRLNYKNLENYLNSNTKKAFVLKILSIWPTSSYIDNYGHILRVLFKELLLDTSIKKTLFLEELNAISAESTVHQKYVIALVLNKSSLENVNFSESLEPIQTNYYFEKFIKKLRYFVAFKSFNRLEEATQKEQLFSSFIKYKSNLILKKQLHSWSKENSKIVIFLKVIPENRLLEVVEIIHPKLLITIANFNSILKKLNYRDIDFYIAMETVTKKVQKLLKIWSSQRIIVKDTFSILYKIIDEFLSKSNIKSEYFIEQLTTLLPNLTINQKELVVVVLQYLEFKNTSNTSLEEAKPEETVDLSKDAIYINNAGLIIIWPFLSTLFTKLGLLQGRNFIDDVSRQKAIVMTNYIVYGEAEFDESNLVLNKILCGVNPDFFVDSSIVLSDLDKTIGESLLVAVTKNWDKLNNTSPSALRESFLKREGILKKNENNFNLIVETKPYDLLLKTIPWNIMMIQTAFMDNRLLVEWKI